MNLYLISQDYNHGDDTYDSAVVAARSAGAAQRMDPDPLGSNTHGLNMWAPPEHVTVQYLGKARADLTKEGVVLASFNAG